MDTPRPHADTRTSPTNAYISVGQWAKSAQDQKCPSPLKKCPSSVVKAETFETEPYVFTVQIYTFCEIFMSFGNSLVRAQLNHIEHGQLQIPL